MHPDNVIKTNTDNSCWQTDLSSCTLYTSGKADGNLVLQVTLPGAKRPPYMGSAFLGKYASITVVIKFTERIGILEGFVNLI